MSIYCDKCGETIFDGVMHLCSRQIVPICPFCKVEMRSTTIQIGNGCGKYFDEIVWDCNCMDYELEKQFKKVKMIPKNIDAKSVKVERFVSPQLAWMINYIEDEKFPKEHLEALCRIVALFNDCEESEKEIFDFAYHLFKRYVDQQLT